MQTDRRKVRQIIARYFERQDDDPAVIKCADEILTGKKGDMMDGALFFMQSPEMQLEAQILDDLESGLKVYYKRDTDNFKAAKNIRLDMEKYPTRNVSRWLAWCRADEWRLGHLNIYKDINKVIAEWPQQDIIPAAQTGSRRLPPMRD